MIILGIILAALWAGRNAIHFAKNYHPFTWIDKDEDQ